jgi:hypothetical protein
MVVRVTVLNAVGRSASIRIVVDVSVMRGSPWVAAASMPARAMACGGTADIALPGDQPVTVRDAEYSAST